MVSYHKFTHHKSAPKLKKVVEDLKMAQHAIFGRYTQTSFKFNYLQFFNRWNGFLSKRVEFFENLDSCLSHNNWSIIFLENW